MIFLFVTLVSMIMVMKFLLHRGTNKDLRNQILIRYGLLFLVVVPDQIACLYYTLTYHDDHLLLS